MKFIMTKMVNNIVCVNVGVAMAIGAIQKIILQNTRMDATVNIPTTIVWINLSYATFGLVVRNGIVIQAPPIARWTIGKSSYSVTNYYNNKGAKIEYRL